MRFSAALPPLLRKTPRRQQRLLLWVHSRADKQQQQHQLPTTNVRIDLKIRNNDVNICKRFTNIFVPSLNDMNIFRRILFPPKFCCFSGFYFPDVFHTTSDMLPCFSNSQHIHAPKRLARLFMHACTQKGKRGFEIKGNILTGEGLHDDWRYVSHPGPFHCHSASSSLFSQI